MDIIPQQLRVISHERVKYACPCCDGGLRLAAKPAQVIPKGLFTESLLAWVITSKYMDGLPLYRHAALLGRFGGSDLSRNTLATSVARVGQAVQPVINLLRDLALDAPLIYGDETEIQVRSNGSVQELHVGADGQPIGARRNRAADPPIRALASCRLTASAPATHRNTGLAVNDVVH